MDLLCLLLYLALEDDKGISPIPLWRPSVFKSAWTSVKILDLWAVNDVFEQLCSEDEKHIRWIIEIL